MRAVTVAARLIRVRPDRVRAILRAIVATHARRLVIAGSARECVAVLARRCVNAGMQRRHLLGMAARAHVGRRRLEARTAVARVARDLADVRDVARARRDVAIRRRHLLRCAIRAPAASDRERDEDGDADHGRDPIGWHNRQGIELSGTRLDQPGECGLPPTRPTAWQPTHKLWPAPSWQLAHAVGSRRASRPCALSAAVGPTQPGGCGLRRELPAISRDAWQLAQRSVEWHFAHAPGSARASSACRDAKPARWSAGANGSANRAVAGRIATVLP